MEKVYQDNIVIGHYKGMAIVEKENGILFYIDDMDEAMAPAGTIVEEELLECLGNLRTADQAAIKRAFGRRDLEW